jgi:hypothetical protein
MAGDSDLFASEQSLRHQGCERRGANLVRGSDRWVPLLEAKLIHHFNHRYADFGDQPGKAPDRSSTDSLSDPHFLPSSRYWVPADALEKRLPADWSEGWIMGWRNICRSTDERTVIATVAPRVALGHSVNLLYPAAQWRSRAALLQANLSSLVFDWCARQKLSGVNLTQSVFRQLPVLPPERYEEEAPWTPGSSLGEWLMPRVLELTYTSWDLEDYAKGSGYHGAPFPWDVQRRRQLRAEIDAAYLWLYGVEEDEIELVIDSFDGLARREQRELGGIKTAPEVLAALRSLHVGATSIDVR